MGELLLSQVNASMQTGLRKNASSIARKRRAAFGFALILGALVAWRTPARALEPAAIVLPGSVQPVAEAPAGGAAKRPMITRHNLKPQESAAALQFEVALKMRNFGELEARVQHGEQISPREMAERYEPLPSDYDAVAAWLSEEGLTITRRDSHHVGIFARGSISQIEKALGVNFARVAFEGKEYTSAISAPSVPAALEPVLLGINGLQPHLHAHKHIIWRQASPDALGGGASYLPKQIAQAYSATSLYSQGIVGSGQSIAIVIDTFPATGDLEAFWQDAGVSQSIQNIQFIQAVPGTLAAPSGEETLDTEWSSSMAPGAHVRVYAATDLEDADLDEAYQRVYDDVINHPELGIHQMSMSYGEGEQYTTLSQVDTDDQFFAELAAAGVTIFAASGDDGSTPGAGGTGDENGPVQVESPASDPNVTGVGGTTLILDSNNDVTSEVVWNENGGASGGGLSIYFAKPTWQKGTGVVSGTDREVPDVAASADPDYGAIIVEGGVEQTVGGTSWGTPTWAAFSALINSARAGTGEASVGLLGPATYPLINGANYTSEYPVDFRDITSGNNATRDSGGDYSATHGYDLCTGLGAPLMTPLTEYIAGSSSLVGIEMPGQVEEVIPGNNGSFTVSVTGTSAAYQWQRMPVGTTVWSNLTDDGTYSGSTQPTLAILDTSTTMSGDEFQCLVTVGANVITTSPPSVLVVDTPFDISTLAGQVQVTGLANGLGADAQFNYPSGVALDSFGNIYVADYGNNQIREVTPTGSVSTPYGNIEGGSGRGNGSGNNASFNEPNSVAIDGSGNIYVADSGNSLIRKISGGLVSTFAGSGGQLDSPEGVAVDGSGNVYVADSGNDVVRKITAGGTISTLAGEVGNPGYADGAAGSAQFNNPTNVAVDGLGNVYVSDLGNSVVRKVAGGTVSTVAGKAGDSGYLDGLGTSALFNSPIGLAVDGSNNLYITDSLVPATNSTQAGNNLLRKLTPAGVVSTLAGEAGITGSSDGNGSNAQFYSLQAVTMNAAGEAFLADTYNQTIRSGTASATAGIPATRVISLSGDLAFGDVVLNGTATSTLTISNTGNAVLTVSNIAFPSGFSGNWSSGTIPSDGSQDVTVSFTPTASIEYSGNIAVTSNATAGSAKIAVSGSGVAVPVEPTVSTFSATNINSTAALLNGFVDPEGSTTTVYFQYGLTGTYGLVSGSSNAGIAKASEPFSENISGLQPDTLYHYQAVASNAGGTVFGLDQTFTTAAFTTTPIVASGDAAAGVTGGEFLTPGEPAMNDAGYIAFEAVLASRAGGVSAANNSGIWAQNGAGAIELIARTGSVAPGGGRFLALGNPVYNNNEAVAFIGTLAGGNSTNDTGVWSSSGGSLALVARAASQAPGYPNGVTFTAFSGIALPDQGGVLIRASVSDGGVGIWAGDSINNLQLILKEGDIVGGDSVSKFVFLPTLPYVGGQSRGFAQATGAFVCHVLLSSKINGIAEIAGTSTQLVEESLASAPGTSGGEFSGFSNPAVNAGGYVAFTGTLATGVGGVSGSNRIGIWADDNTGTLQLIARSGSAAPGTSATFRNLGDPVYSGSEAVAFRASLNLGTGEANSSNDAGIWSDSGGSLALVAREGSQAAGCPTGVTFKLFNALALPDQNGVLLLATLNGDSSAGINSTNNVGIWAVNSSGNLQLVVRTGQTVNGKVITGLRFLPTLTQVQGQTRNFSQATGNLIYEAIFSDKTRGIFSVTF